MKKIIQALISGLLSLFSGLCATSTIDTKQAIEVAKSNLQLSGKITAEKFKGGFSGAHIFAVTAETKKYVIRFVPQKTLDERKEEFANLQIASDAKYGPKIYCVDAKQGFVIMEFLEHQTNSLSQEQTTDLLADLLRKIHLGPNFNKIQNQHFSYAFNVINEKIKILKTYELPDIPLSKIETIATTVQKALETHRTSAPCHNDFDPTNIMFLGNEFRAIDFETAAMDDPYFDIAMAAIFYCKNNPTSEHLLLSKYLERKPSDIELSKLYLAKIADLLCTALCFLSMVPEQFHHYKTLSVPPYQDFMNAWLAGNKTTESPEHKLMFAKVLINHIFDTVESKEFSNATRILNKN
jgi:thiamine kinase-like enzyme